MKKVVGIKSIRNIRQGTRSWDIVFEWEDVFSQSLKLPIICKNRYVSKIKCLLANVGLQKLFNRWGCRKNLYLEFVSNVKLVRHSWFDSNIIPIIIDFWYVGQEISDFIQYFNKVPLVIVTNREVYCILQKHDCPFNVEY